jgi:hypothetical protein
MKTLILARSNTQSNKLKTVFTTVVTVLWNVYLLPNLSNLALKID